MGFFEKIKTKFLGFDKKLNKLNKDRNHTDVDQEARRLDEEKRFYDREHPVEPQDKVIRESGGQDISAI